MIHPLYCGFSNESSTPPHLELRRETAFLLWLRHFCVFLTDLGVVCWRIVPLAPACGLACRSVGQMYLYFRWKSPGESTDKGCHHCLRLSFGQVLSSGAEVLRRIVALISPPPPPGSTHVFHPKYSSVSTTIAAHHNLDSTVSMLYLFFENHLTRSVRSASVSSAE